eukprot:TRINITY_DN94_c0_g1_i1.p1 TRINITY_DN94_c0_g1~~TRINITY_DN94_c0_g1_i1.p1  ORF type:complete len:220 (+),score=61.41 TRINITY_DN94_c0_g1_i1:80-739(+)
MSGKPCKRCGKTAFPLESLKAGEDSFHKLCFRCPESKCNVQLTLKTFKRDPATGEVYCDKHVPKPTHTQVSDSISTKSALSAPKTANAQGVHKADPKVAPKRSDQYGNDRTTESGEFEKEAEQSKADTGVSWGAQNVQSGTFENEPEESKAATGGSWGAQNVQSGTFENEPEESKAATGGSWGAQNVQSGTFESNPEPSRAQTGGSWGAQQVESRGGDD